MYDILWSVILWECTQTCYMFVCRNLVCPCMEKCGQHASGDGCGQCVSGCVTRWAEAV